MFMWADNQVLSMVAHLVLVKYLVALLAMVEILLTLKYLLLHRILLLLEAVVEVVIIIVVMLTHHLAELEVERLVALDKRLALVAITPIMLLLVV